ncbi:MAG TPA: hypothetical protein VGH81_09420 [Rudaea sp.]
MNPEKWVPLNFSTRQFAFVLPLLCYLYIAFYGLNGSRLQDAQQAPA